MSCCVARTTAESTRRSPWLDDRRETGDADVVFDELDLGAEPRRPASLSRQRLIVLSVVVLLAAAATVVWVQRPWQHAATGQLAATGAHCTVGFGTSLVVVAVEVVNASSVATTVGGVSLAASSRRARQVGGPIDIVTADGCSHVLALRGDVVPAGGTVWLGVTAEADTCEATTVALRVGFDGGSGADAVTVDVALGAAVAPACPALSASEG